MENIAKPLRCEVVQHARVVNVRGHHFSDLALFSSDSITQVLEDGVLNLRMPIILQSEARAGELSRHVAGLAIKE